MSFPAKFPGKCSRCKQPIKIGQDIKSPTRQAFVHSGCAQLLTRVEQAVITELCDDLRGAGFTCVVAGFTGVWARGTTEVQFAQVDDELLIGVYVAGISLRVAEPQHVVHVINRLENLDDIEEEEDEFEAYRTKLLERYEK